MITIATYMYVALSVEDLNFTISTLQVSVFNGTDEACDLDSLCVIKKFFLLCGVLSVSQTADGVLSLRECKLKVQFSLILTLKHHLSRHCLFANASNKETTGRCMRPWAVYLCAVFLCGSSERFRR